MKVLPGRQIRSHIQSVAEVESGDGGGIEKVRIALIGKWRFFERVSKIKFARRLI